MIRGALITAAIALTATVAAAQDGDLQTGTRFMLYADPIDQTDMRVLQKRIVRCAAMNAKENARELLLNSDPVTVDASGIEHDYQEFMAEFDLPRCIGRAMPPSARRMGIRFDNKTLRNLLAEEMYLYENKKGITIPESAPVILENRFYAGGEPYRMAKAPADLADCVVHTAPDKAHALLKANPTTRKESDAANALLPVFDRCADDAGEQQLTLAQMRAVVADGLWSRAHYGPQANSTEGEGE
ncbi:hypothetical protein [Erythrobacter sp. THAF29]|uniref:hypothetical protein n=1 Tax=Erythrobacter sp. THAF29 TaxID=2587851 RepID=UPI0012696950|nr:hypothetical protein [Erythrobacter sp. THAF29]QFT77995.1 hypothetical protein FIU90_10650 [Erythrobacter sp. THAF29]